MSPAAVGEVRAAALLDGRYTFRNFVVGTGNRLAYAAAKSVAESPGESYSPLVIHAPAGLGKTHLLAAIGRQVLLESSHLAVHYVSAEAWGDALLAARARSDLERFRQRFRELDVLLFDDLHSLPGDPDASEELLRILEALRGRNGQAVLALDRAPEEVAGLDARLVAHLHTGLVVDARNPDHETRSAILRFKTRERGQELSPEVVDEVAGRDFSSVRELEDALDRLLALRRLNRGPLTPARVRDLLGRSLPPRSIPGEPSEFEDFLSDVAATLSEVLERAPAAPGPGRRAARDEEASEAPVAVAALAVGRSAVEAAGRDGAARRQEPAPERLPPPLGEYGFGGWVEGPANRFAAESARRVAAEPGTRYNPLFLHGPVGMGKTHLLNAIGNAVLERDPRACVAYRSAEELAGEFIQARAGGSVARLRARNRTLDVLLLDDVHALAGRDSAQEELFHLFNDLYARRRQIVLASDRAPRDLAGVEQRLVSRFEGGLVAEIGPLDEATAARALLAFMRGVGFVLEEDLAVRLVRRLEPRNVRELEGQVRRAALRAESSGAGKDAAFLERILLRPRPGAPARGAGRVDPFFTDPGKVFLHWAPIEDRLIDRLDGEEDRMAIQGSVEEAEG